VQRDEGNVGVFEQGLLVRGSVGSAEMKWVELGSIIIEVFFLNPLQNPTTQYVTGVMRASTKTLNR